MSHASPGAALLLALISGLVLAGIFSARRGRELYIRRIPGISAMEEAVGRATEMGRPIFFCAGLYGLKIETLQALAIASYLVRLSARYGTRMIVPVYDAAVFPIAREMLREAYQAEGHPELYNPNDVSYLSDRQFAYASACVGLMNREKVTTCFYFGGYYGESLILSEAGRQLGAVQVAGTPEVTQLPFFVASCDYTIMGEEFYATTAYLTREPVLLGSLVGQDRAKMVLLALVLLGSLLSLLLGANNPFSALFPGTG
ncbi:MAG TPA: DUF6754 domain-containing protein [Armatimonadota bacterium]|jgi:hypothetical protein